MAQNKIKRGEDWIDFDLLTNNINSDWDYNIIPNYNYGKTNLEEMQKQKDIILNGLLNGTITYNPTTTSNFQFTVNQNIPELKLGSDELKYAAGWIGDYLRRAIILQEEPWNAINHYNNLLKERYWNGQEPDTTSLKALNQQQKIIPYNDIIKIFASGADKVPEDQREDYLKFWDKIAPTYITNDGEITNNELLELERRAGKDSFSWMLASKGVEAPTIKEDKVIEKPVDLTSKKEPEYEPHHSLYLDEEMNEEDFKFIMSLNNQDYQKLLSYCVSYPNEEVSKINLPYLITRKILESKQSSGYLDLGVKSRYYDFFYDINNNEIVKKKANNLALFKNVETPKIEDKKEPDYVLHTDIFLDEDDFDETVVEQVMEMSDMEFKQNLGQALSNPELSKEILPYFIIRKLETSKSNEDYLDLELTSTNGYKFFFDRKNNKIVKAHKSNFAIHQNVETPKVEEKKDNKK